MHENNCLSSSARYAVVGMVVAVLTPAPAAAMPDTTHPWRAAGSGPPAGWTFRQCRQAQCAAGVTGGDHTGRYLVGDAILDDANHTVRGLLWDNGKPREVSTESLAPYAWVDVTDVNRRGVIVGYRTNDFHTFHTDAWILRLGRFTTLPGLNPTDSTKAVAINARGDVVGSSETPP